MQAIQWIQINFTTLYTQDNDKPKIQPHYKYQAHRRGISTFGKNQEGKPRSNKQNDPQFIELLRNLLQNKQRKNMIVLQFSETEFREILTDVVQDAIQNASITGIPEKESHIKGISGLSKFLGVSHSRAQALKNSGIFPHFQQGRLILFDTAKVREAMAIYNKQSKRAKGK
jgi:hypothetical protein